MSGAARSREGPCEDRLTSHQVHHTADLGVRHIRVGTGTTPSLTVGRSVTGVVEPV